MGKNADDEGGGGEVFHSMTDVLHTSIIYERVPNVRKSFKTFEVHDCLYLKSK